MVITSTASERQKAFEYKHDLMLTHSNILPLVATNIEMVRTRPKPNHKRRIICTSKNPK